MITYNQFKTSLTSPALAGMSITDQYTYRQSQLEQLKESPEYFMMPITEQKAFDRNVLTNDFIGYSPEELEAQGNVRAADYARQIQAVKSGSVVPLDALDGFIDGIKNSLTGKIGIGIADAFTSKNLSAHVFDDDIAEELKNVRDTAFKDFAVQGTVDYNIAKGVGLAAGIAADIYATSKLYGAVKAPGLLVRPITGKGVSKIMAKASEFTAKQISAKMTPYWFGQMAVETVGFQVEAGLADYVTGEMDRDGGFTSWLKTNYKSNLAQGFGYFLAGEFMSAGMGSIGKLYGKTFTGKGYREQTAQKLRSMTSDEQMNFLKRAVMSPDMSGDEAMALKAIDPDVFKRLKKMKREMNFLEKLESADAQFQYVFSRNFDADIAVDEAGKYTLKGLQGKEINRTFNDRNSLLSFVAKEDKVIRNELFDASFNRYKDRTSGFNLTFKGQGEVKSVNGTFSSIQKTFAPNDFRVRADNVESFLKEINPDKPIAVVLKDDFFTNPPKMQEGIFFAPSKIDSREKQSEFLKQFKLQMKQQYGLSSLKDIDVKNYLENLGTYNRYSIDWIDDVLGTGSAVKRDGRIFVQTPDGQVKDFANETEAGRYVHALTIDERSLNTHLSNKHGYRLKVEEDGGFSIRNAMGGTITSDDTLTNLLMKNPQFLPYKPIDTSGLVLQITNGEAAIEKKLANGSFKKITDKLKDYGRMDDIFKRENQIKTPGFTINLREATGEYNVKLVNGLEKDFRDLAEAKKWANMDWDSMKVKIEELEEYGYKVYATEAGYLVKDLQGNKWPIRDRDGLLEFMKNNQAIKNIDSLDGLGRDESTRMAFDIEDEVTELRNEVIKKGAKQKAAAAKAFGWQEKLSELLEPVKKSFERYGYKEVDDVLNRYLSANRLFEAKDVQTKTWVSNIFKDFNTYEKETLGKIMMEEKALDPIYFKAQLQKYDLDPENVKYYQITQQAREFFNRMGIVAGVDTGDFIPNYLPRFLDVKMSDLLNRELKDGEIFNRYWSKSIPANMDPFMRKMRKTDIVRMQEVNLQSIMDSYAEIAWRSQYLESYDKELGTIIEKLQTESANSNLIYQLKAFKERMVGRAFDKDAIEIARQYEHNQANAEKIMSNKFLKKVLSAQQQTQVAGWAKRSNPISGAKALMTSALMSFKLRMPVRNMAQIWTHLGAIYDNPEILRALKAVSDNPDAIYKEMAERGIFNPRQGRSSGQLMSWFRNVNQVGMNWHQNSDDFDRMIGYMTAKTRFGAALAQMKQGKLDLDGFHKVAGSWALDDVDKLKISDYLQTGKLGEAESVLTSRVVEKCFLDYSSAAKPLAQNSGVANLFMQYSTFPLQTAQLWRNTFFETLKKDPKMAAASMARVSANIAGLSVLFSELIGYSNSPMSFFNYMMFTGGPAAGAAAESVSAIANSSSPTQALKGIADANKDTFTPFYGATKAMRKSLQSLIDGEELMSLKYALGGTGKEQTSVLDYVNF